MIIIKVKILKKNFLNPEYAKYRGKPLDNGKAKRYTKVAQKYGEYIRKEDEEILVTLANTINGGICLVRGRSYTVFNNL